MVYIELNGRIGNHLFQIATGASYAKKYNQDFIIVCHDGYYLPDPDNCYIKDYIKQFQDNIFKNIPIQYKRPSADCAYYYEKNLSYVDIPYYKNVLLYGTFQSYKYFDKDLVEHLFKIPFSIKKYIEDKYGYILKKDVVSIHVRRGDYCKDPHKYPVCSLSYFKNAINYMGKNNCFFIISDDIEWCKNYFKGDNFYFSDYEKPIIDLYIQTLCKNNIISNSTFSWWGAWLNNNPDKIVICPKPWFGRSFKNRKVEDLIPNEWIQMQNKLTPTLEFKAKILHIQEKFKNLISMFLRILKKYR